MHLPPPPSRSFPPYFSPMFYSSQARSFTRSLTRSLARWFDLSAWKRKATAATQANGLKNSGLNQGEWCYKRSIKKKKRFGNERSVDCVIHLRFFN